MNELIIIIHFIDATPYGVTFFFFCFFLPFGGGSGWRNSWTPSFVSMYFPFLSFPLFQILHKGYGVWYIDSAFLLYISLSFSIIYFSWNTVNLIFSLFFWYLRRSIRHFLFHTPSSSWPVKFLRIPWINCSVEWQITFTCSYRHHVRNIPTCNTSSSLDGVRKVSHEVIAGWLQPLPEITTSI